MTEYLSILSIIQKNNFKMQQSNRKVNFETAAIHSGEENWESGCVVPQIVSSLT